MKPHTGIHVSHATPHLTLPHRGGLADSARLRSADQTLELCLLDTQRQVHRLEEIVHRLTSVAATGGEPPTGVMSMIQEGNRRLQRRIDEFSVQSHAILRVVRPPAVPIEGSADR